MKSKAKQICYEQRQSTNKELEHMLNFKYCDSYTELKKRKSGCAGSNSLGRKYINATSFSNICPLIYGSKIFLSRDGMLLFNSFGWILLPWTLLVFLNLRQILASLTASEMLFHNLFSISVWKNIISFLMNCPISFIWYSFLTHKEHPVIFHLSFSWHFQSCRSLSYYA